MRVVVAGGTGFIGREVVKLLLERGGDEVVVTTREPSQSRSWPGRVEEVQAFAGDILSLGKAFTRADVVVNCIQFHNHPVEDPSKGRTYMATDGRGTTVAVEAAKRVGVRRFVYLSGAGRGRGGPSRGSGPRRWRRRPCASRDSSTASCARPGSTGRATTA